MLMVEEIGFCGNVFDIWDLRLRVHTMEYWEDSFAAEKLHLVLNVKAAVIRRAVDGRYEAVREAPPHLALVFPTMLNFSSPGTNGRIANWLAFRQERLRSHTTKSLLAIDKSPHWVVSTPLFRRLPEMHMWSATDTWNPSHPGHRYPVRLQSIEIRQFGIGPTRKTLLIAMLEIRRRRGQGDTTWVAWRTTSSTAAPSDGAERARGQRFVAWQAWRSSKRPSTHHARRMRSLKDLVGDHLIS